MSSDEKEVYMPAEFSVQFMVFASVGLMRTLSDRGVLTVDAYVLMKRKPFEFLALIKLDDDIVTSVYTESGTGGFGICTNTEAIDHLEAMLNRGAEKIDMVIK